MSESFDEKLALKAVKHLDAARDIAVELNATGYNFEGTVDAIEHARKVLVEKAASVVAYEFTKETCA